MTERARIVIVHPDIEADIINELRREAAAGGFQLITGEIGHIDDEMRFRQQLVNHELSQAMPAISPVERAAPRGAQWKNEPMAYGPRRKH